MKRNGLVPAGVALLLSIVSVHGIEGIKLAVQGSNAIVTWPSVEGETYIVRHRATLQSDTPWVTLTASLSAALNTNRTGFVHTGIVIYPVCTNQSGGTAEGPPPAPSSPSVFERWKGEGREPYTWEREKRPPLPWDPETEQQMLNRLTSPESLLTEALAPECQPRMGFYQVVRDGVHVIGLTNLTNGALSGAISLAFEAGNGEGILDSAVVLIDGLKFPGANVLSAGLLNRWQFGVDTAFMENGAHIVEIEVTWHDPGNPDGDRVFASRRSAPFTVSVSNAIYYPEWEPETGEAPVCAYFVKTTTINANWQIDIYDVRTNLVRTLTGQTADGSITAYWNMIDSTGTMRTNADVDPEFKAVVTVSGGAFSAAGGCKVTPPKKQRKRDWPGQGRWTIAYQDFFKFDYSENSEMTGSIIEFANTASKYGGYYLYYPPPGRTNDIGQTFPIRYQDSNHPDTNITAVSLAKDEIMLQNFLGNTNSRNFYYNGHGSASSIAGISSATFAALIHHRYRFVFLDGCNTANGSMDDAFGIRGPGRFALIYYQNTGIRPGAFVGYEADVPYALPGPVVKNGVPYDGEIPWQVPFFIFNFLFYWDADLVGESLAAALRDAKDDLPQVQGFAIQPGEHLQIYGYDDLRIDKFNRRADWP